MNRWSLAAGAVVCAAYLTLAATSMWGSSATFDEGVNISSGYTYLTRGDFRLVPVHPPLMKMISALPLVSWGAACDYDSTGWRAAEPWSFAHQFLYVWNDGDSVLRLARAPTAAFALVLGLAVALWSRRHGGSALVALALCLFNPEVLAHGQLATNDLPVACCIFVAVAGFERLVSTATWPRWLLVAGAVGAAVTCKYTGLVLGPVIAVLGAVAILGPWPIDWRVRPGAHRLLATRAHKAAAVGLLLGGILAMVWAFIWLSYLLKARVSPNAEVAARVAARVGPAQGVLGQVALFAGQRRALPEAFTLGFVDTLRRSGGRPAFLHGRLSEEGWWHYYPVALGIKTPLGLQVLLVLAAVLAMRGRLPARWLAFTLPPGAIIAVFVLTSRVDLGLRLALPLYPFMIVAGALAAARLWERRLTRVLASILVAWAVGAAMRVHPHYLSYFNELIGGPTQGYRWLVDSSVDWGQDLKRLQTRIADLGAQEVKLSYFGSADPAYYKLPVQMLPSSMRPQPRPLCLFVRPGDVIAVSATNLQGVYLPRSVEPLLAALRSRKPFDRAGYSILLYRADFFWLLEPEAAQELDWLADAVRSYRQATVLNPEWAEAHGHLGTALEMQERHGRALQAFADAVRLDPGYFERWPSHRLLAERARARAAVREE